MATLGQRGFAIDNATIKFMSLAGDEWARALTIGNKWQKLRLGIQFAVTPNGTSNITTARLVLGLCSGTANPYRATSTTNFIGALIAHTSETGDTWTYAANGGFPYYSGGGRGAYATRVGASTSISAFANNGGIPQIVTTDAPQRRTVFYVDITKGSPNFTIQTFSQMSTSVSQTDIAFDKFISHLERDGAPIDPTMTASDANTIACSETPGPLDSIDIYWNKAAFPMEIYSVGAYRLA